MNNDAKQAGIIVGVELVKALLSLAFYQAKVRGLTAEDFERVYLEERIAFLSKDPALIPDVK